MARQQQEQLSPKLQAVRDLEAARAALSQYATLAIKEWSPQEIVTRSIEKHRALWLGGAALAGLALIKWVWPANETNHGRDNSHVTAKNRGLIALLLSPLLALGRKTLINYGAQVFESFVHQQVSANSPDAGKS